MAHQSGFAGTEVAVQGNECVGQCGRSSQRTGERVRGGLIAPVGKVPGFYNGVVTKICTQFDGNQLVSQIQAWARELGFSQIGVAGVDLSSAEPGLLAWLERGYHGEMDYMQRHGLKRARPVELEPGTLSVITARMDYLPRDTPDDWVSVEWSRLQRPREGIVSVYARGRDYHKVLRQRLQKLADRIQSVAGTMGHRVFTDSAPVLEAELAARSGLGWRGKHTLVLQRDAGSMFFLGEIFIDALLPLTEATTGHCGTCTACIDVCPTGAIVGPQQVDARRCISYLTIEHQGPIPLELRPLMGNRIYGCDDCQLACPWNKYAQQSALPDFDARDGLHDVQLTGLLAWSETEFLERTEGNPVRRIGHTQWQRNIVVAIGNALRAEGDAMERMRLLDALSACERTATELVAEHIRWARAQSTMHAL